MRISDWSSDVCSSDLATWDQKLEAHQKRSAIATGKETADEMTTEALARLETLYSILAHTLKLDDRVDWETLKERTPFAGDHRFPESERSEERRVGKECGRTCRSRGSAQH